MPEQAFWPSRMTSRRLSCKKVCLSFFLQMTLNNEDSSMSWNWSQWLTSKQRLHLKSFLVVLDASIVSLKAICGRSGREQRASSVPIPFRG